MSDGLKAFCNKIKSKGLQKLRWYCQMCQKQCRDENGMKCHMKSESHLRQMKVFADNPDQIISQYSKQFEKAFLDVLSHGHGTKRVSINKVYKEYISHKEHVCYRSHTSSRSSACLLFPLLSPFAFIREADNPAEYFILFDD